MLSNNFETNHKSDLSLERKGLVALVSCNFSGRQPDRTKELIFFEYQHSRSWLHWPPCPQGHSMDSYINSCATSFILRVNICHSSTFDPWGLRGSRTSNDYFGSPLSGSQHRPTLDDCAIWQAWSINLEHLIHIYWHYWILDLDSLLHIRFLTRFLL